MSATALADRIARAGAFTALGICGGLATTPAWLWLAARLGTALGLGPRPASPPVLSGGPLFVSLVAAPLVEELVYRGLFLDAFGRSRLGRGVGVVASSAAFAAAHDGAWARLATFGVGLALGATRAGGAALGYCVAIHAGLNLGTATGIWRGATPLVTAAGALAWLIGAAGWRRRSGP